MTNHSDNRPLSPHLQVYRLPITALMSILHRMTGVALAIGTLLVIWVLIAAATGPEAYNLAQSVIGSPVGMVLLFGWSAALYYHMLNGIRHLIWDTGKMLRLKDARAGGYVVLAGAALLTAGTWAIVLL